MNIELIKEVAESINNVSVSSFNEGYRFGLAEQKHEINEWAKKNKTPEDVEINEYQKGWDDAMNKIMIVFK